MVARSSRDQDKTPASSHPEDDLERAEHLKRDLGFDLAAVGPSTGGEDEATGGQPPGPRASGPRALSPSTADLERLYEISRAIHATLDIEQLLPRILDFAIAHAGAERGILFYFDPRQGKAAPWVVRGADSQAVAAAEAFSRTILEQARSEAVHTDDALVDPRFEDAESVALHAIRSVVCVPIPASQRVVGAIYLDNLQSGRRLSPDAIRFIGVLAGLSGPAIQNAERYSELALANQRLRRELASRVTFDEIVGRCRPMAALLENVTRVAPTDFPVLLLGESGTGKELLAHALHRASRRADGPFVAQNCAAIPGELLESELFGHARGAFTGAHAEREGIATLADRGTLFLDEIAELDLRLQAKLLRVLDDRMVRPVGSNRERRVDFRLVCATSADLLRAVDQGKFRRDLLYRLNVITLRVPPLRERRADIPLLLRHFLALHTARAGGKEISFTDAALKALERAPWPGNVRELEHFVKRALIMAERPVVDAGDLPRFLEAEEQERSPDLELPLGAMTLEQIETAAIREAMRRTGGNQAQAAALLGMHRNAFLRRLQKIGPA